ncbi:hypothetical protein KO494_05970 [Lacinutrix sp. C3R15]|uniref:hypothetical protein n=1 Tax=Flavobacteriaceae TaxID=49546 RepID=UPI001C0860B3|nr:MULTISPECIES: hypothetical protein [Flavobacteriaceae]MBU2939084.1 hypothetical protein [Lacinutrix sp. C3R15]MDO6622399.1 hypothetical protein [Oceanihabitans sp. 1_MG-2023]
MKKLLLLLCIIFMSTSAIAQNTYTINNEELTLKTEIEGDLDLLWNTIDSQFRYFVKTTDNTIIELVNTKDSNNKYQEEYKTVLNTVSNNSIPTKKVNLTLPSLRSFFDLYNASQDANYKQTERVKIKTRIGVFGGVTNNPFVENPDNKTTALFGAELEFFGSKIMPRHAGFIGVRHAAEHKDFKYAATQIALGYRYRFINQSNFNIYANVKFATYTITNTENDSGGVFDAPFIFGLGTDIKVCENGFITFAYNELFSIFIDNQGNFPIDFAVGYKMNL